MIKLVTVISSLMVASIAVAGPMSFAERVANDMQGEHRSDANQARNAYRHPQETLSFFGIEDGMTVMEIWPGGGWYTEILAPAMRGHGKLIVATWDPKVEDQPDYRYELPKKMDQNFAKHPGIYDEVSFEYFSPPLSASLGDADSIDVIVTFRNSHGWINSGLAQDIFSEFARVLKPGGTLGVVQHRAEEGSDAAVTAKNGYVPEQAIKDFAAKAGLVFDGGSEINANPKDTRDHPSGVWSLPPSFGEGEKDKAGYAAIGESDRMTLRFSKPE